MQENCAFLPLSCGVQAPTFLESSNLFEGLIILLAGPLHVVRRRFWRFLQNPREVAQIVGGQYVQSMRVKRSDAQKD